MNHHAAHPECGRTLWRSWAIDEKIEVLTTGAGNHGQVYRGLARTQAIKVMPVVCRRLHWQKPQLKRAGARDAVIAEGMEGGGHIGELNHHAARSAGRRRTEHSGSSQQAECGRPRHGSWHASSALKASQCGTVFLALHECYISERVQGARPQGTRHFDRCLPVVRPVHPVRSLKTPMARKCLELEKQKHRCLPLRESRRQPPVLMRRPWQDGQTNEEGTIMSGQNCGYAQGAASVRGGSLKGDDAPGGGPSEERTLTRDLNKSGE